MNTNSSIKDLDIEKAHKFLNRLKCSRNNWQIVKIAGDASFRSYYRVFVEDRITETFILMYAPVGLERIDHFIAVDQFLCKNGFLAPKIIAVDEANGMLLLEDFGDDSFSKILLSNLDRESELYKKAIDLLLNLHKISISTINLTSYNNRILFDEVKLFIDWYLLLIKKSISDNQKADFKFYWLQLFDQINKEDRVLVLRDYHVDNLMEIRERKGVFSVGLLDFQDALIGSRAYDLVSILEDARRDVSGAVKEELLSYFLKNSSSDKISILNDYEIFSLQRNIKILGIFARLSLRDKKNSYLRLLPRVQNLVSQRLTSSFFNSNFKKLMISML